MCMELFLLREQMEFLNTVAASYHVDIMDGHFVPNITLSPYFIGQIRGKTGLPIEAHLMVTHPESIVDACVDAGADLVSFHTEAVDGKAFRLIEKIKKNNGRVGVVLNPETRLEEARYYLELMDKVTVMTVDPGFAGQRFISQMLNKIEELAEAKRVHGYGYELEVDGACNKDTFGVLARAGAEVFVLGSSGLFGLDPSISTAWKMMETHFNAAIAS